MGSKPRGERIHGSKASGWARAILMIPLAVLFLAPGLTTAKVFTSQQQALREAFPEATRIERDSRIVLSDDLERIRALSGQVDLPRVFVLHTAWQGGRLLGQELP